MTCEVEHLSEIIDSTLMFVNLRNGDSDGDSDGDGDGDG